MFINDGTTAPPRLRSDLNLGVFWDLPAWSCGPQGDEPSRYRAVAEAGYGGVQADKPGLAAAVGLKCTCAGRFDSPDEVATRISAWKRDGYQAASVHVGTGLEDDGMLDAYAHAIIGEARAQHFPLFVETHRATITQDMWRTVRLTERHPDLRFNADLSHWYTGQEMLYGDMEAKLAFIAPVLERVGFMHGRIGTSGNIQVRLDDPRVVSAVATFREMWTRCMVGFLRRAGPGDVLPFNPELLPSCINYAREVIGADGQAREECDRWTESLRMSVIARECFQAAQGRLAPMAATAPK